MFQGFQNRATDALFPAAPKDKRVVVVGIDPKSIQAVDDPLPWPRSRWAELVDGLSEAGASVIAIDATFRGEGDVPEDDTAFADAIGRAGNVVLAVAIDEAVTPESGPPTAKEGSLYGAFGDVAAAVAHVQVTQDPADGVVRRVPLVVDIESPFVLAPALSAAAVATARGEVAVPIVRPDGVQIGSRFMPTDDATNMLLN
jgi:CHASE2 domain-containing sensor protein